MFYFLCLLTVALGLTLADGTYIFLSSCLLFIFVKGRMPGKVMAMARD